MNFDKEINEILKIANPMLNESKRDDIFDEIKNDFISGKITPISALNRLKDILKYSDKMARGFIHKWKSLRNDYNK